MTDARNRAATVLCELHRLRRTTRGIWSGPRAGAETALVLGTLRRRGTLDAILQAYSTRKLPALKPESLAALRVGLFELLFHDNAPTHSVVNAAVDHVKRAGRLKDIGFVNALLRNVMRGVSEVAQSSDPRRSLPRDGKTLLFKRAVFPDSNHDRAAFLAARASTAPWIAARRLRELGPERALTCLELQAQTPPVFLRPAPGRAADVQTALTAAGIESEPGPHAALLRLPPHARASDIFEACGAWVVLQDAVASRVAPFLEPQPGARLLDYCAAPGGKATHLAQLVGPDGHVTAHDVDAERLEMVAENAARLGLEWLVCGEPEGEYDGVLVDAPCSNTGVLARRPEARWRVKERHLPGMVERQLKILKEAAAWTRPGGAVVYSTCSLEPEENLGVVEAFAAAGGFRLEAAQTVYPDEAAGDGGFMARLRRL